MKKAGLKFFFGIIACFLLIGSGTVFAQEPTEGQSGMEAEEPQAVPEQRASAGELPPPLEAEMVVAEHWSKNPYPKTVEAGSRVHIVERGDTLWDLAQRYYNNPFLWPQIWDANKYIPNAHWIYPGDPIVIPPLTPITEEKLAEEMAEEPGEGEEGEEMAAAEKERYPIALPVDLYCSGFITTTPVPTVGEIVGNEQNIERVAQTLFDIVYINQGEAEGISPGDEFTTIQKVKAVNHPHSYEYLGDFMLQTGRIKVVATQEHTATAQVTYSCDAILVGDSLIPFEPKEAPLLSEMPPVDRFGAEGPNAKGNIVYSKDDITTFATTTEVYIDLGAKDGLEVGSRLIIYRFHEKGYEELAFKEELPRRVVGEMVVFNVLEDTSTGRIINMFDYAAVGDKVELR